AHMWATIVEAEDVSAVVDDEDRTMATVHNEPPLRLQLLKATGKREFLVRRVHEHTSRGRPAAGAVGTPDPPSLRGLTPAARLCPAVGGSVVGRFGIHPRASDAARDFAAGGLLDPLPERGAGLEIVHQELGGRKGILPMR